MTSIIPSDLLVLEQSFLYKRPGSKNIPTLEYFEKNDEIRVNLIGVKNFIYFSVGAVAFTVYMADTFEVYGGIREVALDVEPMEQQGLRRFLPYFKEKIIETRAPFVIIFGHGMNGFIETKILSFHETEEEASDEYKRVSDGIKRGDLSVLVPFDGFEPILGLEEGIKLLTSHTSSAGTTQITPN